MSAVSILAGEEFGDSPPCACPVVRAYAIKLNDSLNDKDRQKLKKVAPLILGTRGDAVLERRRAFRCADWAVRTVAASALDKAGVANTLASLEPVTDERTALLARSAANAAFGAAYAANAAAYAAAARAIEAADVADAAATAATAATSSDGTAAATYAYVVADDDVSVKERIAFLVELCEMK